VTTSSRGTTSKKRRNPEDSTVEDEEKGNSKKAKTASRGVALGISPELRERGVGRLRAWEKKIFEKDSEKEDEN